MEEFYSQIRGVGQVPFGPGIVVESTPTTIDRAKARIDAIEIEIVIQALNLVSISSCRHSSQKSCTSLGFVSKAGCRGCQPEGKKDGTPRNRLT